MADDIARHMDDEEKVIYKKFKERFPFPIVAFTRELGIRVFITDELKSDVSGKICKKDGDYIIYLNQNHSPKRNRFTLAHELGHFFCDREYIDHNGEIEDSTKHSDKGLFRKRYDYVTSDNEGMIKMDINANKFAADLLMPHDKFLEIWTQSTNSEDVAKYFDVSIDAVKYRASNLLGVII